MGRPLIAAFAVVAFGVPLASAQNQHSQKILAMTEQQRNILWTKALQSSGEKCNVVVRTMFQGGELRRG
jgi:hypothetical protein